MKAAVGKMLSPGQVPATAVLKDLNRTITKWTRSRERVHIVPLVTVMEKLRAGERVRVGSVEWEMGTYEKLIQSDQLHPTVLGLSLTGTLSLETLSKHHEIPDRAFRLNGKSVARRVLKERGEANEAKLKKEAEGE